LATRRCLARAPTWENEKTWGNREKGVGPKTNKRKTCKLPDTIGRVPMEGNIPQGKCGEEATVPER